MRVAPSTATYHTLRHYVNIPTTQPQIQRQYTFITYLSIYEYIPNPNNAIEEEPNQTLVKRDEIKYLGSRYVPSNFPIHLRYRVSILSTSILGYLDLRALNMLKFKGISRSQDTRSKALRLECTYHAYATALRSHRRPSPDTMKGDITSRRVAPRLERCFFYTRTSKLNDSSAGCKLGKRVVYVLRTCYVRVSVSVYVYVCVCVCVCIL